MKKDEDNQATEKAPEDAVDELGIPDVRKDYGGKSEEEYVRTGFFPKMKKVVSKIPFSADAIALYYAAFDSATPKWARAAGIAALAYFILPVDLIPDALVIVGYTDDATILAVAFKMLSRFVTPAHKHKAREWLHDTAAS